MLIQSYFEDKKGKLVRQLFYFVSIDHNPSEAQMINRSRGFVIIFLISGVEITPLFLKILSPIDLLIARPSRVSQHKNKNTFSSNPYSQASN